MLPTLQSLVSGRPAAYLLDLFSMGNFKQHLTCSTLTGIAIGGIAYQFGFSTPTCLLSAGLCSMAGMLPDIDSDSSRSFQECIYLAAGLCSVLLADRLRLHNIDRDIIMLAGAMMFLFVRFGVGDVIKKITAHRGMFHSIPAAIFSGQIVFFLTTGTIEDRLFKACALSAGYLSHLILDEICSIDSTGKKLRIKKSFGTALKFYDGKRAGIAMCLYAAIVLLGFVAVNNPEALGDFDAAEEYLFAEIKSSDHSAEEIREALTHVRRNNPRREGGGRGTREKERAYSQSGFELVRSQGGNGYAADARPSITTGMEENPVSNPAMYATIHDHADARSTEAIVPQHRRTTEHQFFSKVRSGDETRSAQNARASSGESRLMMQGTRPGIPSVAVQNAGLLNTGTLNPLPSLDGNATNTNTTPPQSYQASMPIQLPWNNTTSGQPIQSQPIRGDSAQSNPIPNIQMLYSQALNHQTPNSPLNHSVQQESVPRLPFEVQGFQPTSLRGDYPTAQNDLAPLPFNMPGAPSSQSGLPLPSPGLPSYNNNYATHHASADDDDPFANPYTLSENDFAPRRRHQPGDMNRGPADLDALRGN